MNANLYVVLMAGGSGTRFWPYSRKAKPKQFLDVLGTGKTLIQSTYDRFLSFCPKENIFVVVREELVVPVKEQLGIGDSQILVEPIGKNTTPCIAYSCYRIGKQSPDSVVIVSPTDHLILREAAFQNTLIKSAEYAMGQDKLVTVGIRPKGPETGYGYIQYIQSDDPFKKVKTFTEKPTLTLAKQYIDSGDFVWNSGIFIWSTQALISAIQKHQPEMAEAFAQASSYFYTHREKEAIRVAYEQSKNISVDYGIMEKADNVYVTLSDFEWSDLGSWNSLYAIQTKDGNGNIMDADTMVYETNNSIIKASQDRLIVVQGLDGYLVGDFGNVTIVCKKDKEAFFRKLIEDLKKNPRADNYL